MVNKEIVIYIELSEISKCKQSPPETYIFKAVIFSIEIASIRLMYI